MSGSPDDVTGLLHAWGGGDRAAGDALFAVLYPELRRRAAARMRGEEAGHTLQPTALVHEAYLRLVDQTRARWQNRAHFLALASQMMRRILVDHARRHRMGKRSGRWVKLTLDEAMVADRTSSIDVEDLDQALRRLAVFDLRKSQVAELRFFGGLTIEETGHVLGISSATAKREWRAARAWLLARLAERRP